MFVVPQVRRIFLETLCSEVSGIADGLINKVASQFYQPNVNAKFTNDAKKLVVQCIQAVEVPDSTILVSSHAVSLRFVAERG
mmetsp:Transcript_14801/g.21566  ORF Transcript_14801/g.21566 Transcript_14801/m.21566 type:complete len:82 (+) Transcript_14801:390-635(+)